MILKKTIRWGLVALFWLFVLGWGISAFAAEWKPATTSYDTDNSQLAYCASSATSLVSTLRSVAACDSYVKSAISKTYVLTNWGATLVRLDSTTFRRSYSAHIASNGVPANGTVTYTFSSAVSQVFVCSDPTFPVGPKLLNGQQVCEKKPVSCKIGEQLFLDSTTGAETCKPNCASVAGQVHENMAYNQAFLPSATVLCYGLCSVTSSGVTVGNANTFEQFGTIQFTGAECPVKFPAEGEGQTIEPNNPPTSSDATNNAQGNLQDAANNATNNPTSGATGTATLNDVVNKVAETSNKEIKAMSEQNAAMGKVIENVGKDIQGAIKDSAHGSGAGASAAQLQTTNAIKDTNKTLQEISDKLDEQKEDPKPPVKPGTSIEPSAKDIHKANDWGTRNFGTVLEANANRFKALPIFSAPSSFFTANFGGSTCPTYSGSFSLFGATTAFQLEAFCSPAVLNMMPYIRAVVMMVFGFLAWRIAVGNGG